MTKHSTPSRRSRFMAVGVVASTGVAASGICAVAPHAGADVSPELAELVASAKVAQRHAEAVTAAAIVWSDQIAVEAAIGVWTDIEEQIERFPVRTAGDLIELAELAKRQIRDGGLTCAMPTALANGILRLFGKISA